MKAIPFGDRNYSILWGGNTWDHLVCRLSTNPQEGDVAMLHTVQYAHSYASLGIVSRGNKTGWLNAQMVDNTIPNTKTNESRVFLEVNLSR